MITPQTTLLGPVESSVEQVMAYVGTVAERKVDVDLYVREIFRLAPLVSLRPLVLCAQAAHETGRFTSSWWTERLNPAGLGITGDPEQNAASWTWANGRDAARAHVAHLLLYARGAHDARADWTRAVGGDLATVDPRYDAYLKEYGDGVAADTISDLTGRWGMDPNYAAGVVAHSNAILATPTKGDNVPTIYPVVGLPGPGIALPVPLSHDIISTSQTNQRPGIARQTPGYWVQHETANPNYGADAAMHNRWLHSGADGNQLSFHFAVDDGAIYQMIPIDEVTWQAADGGGPGNMSGISCELCINAGIDTARSRHNAEALAGGILKALGMGRDRVKRHWDFNAADPNRHHCPDTMLRDGYWPTFVANVGAIIGGTPPKPTYAKRQPIPDPWQTKMVNGHLFVKHGGVVTARAVTPVRLFAAPDAPEVDAPLPKGKRVRVKYVCAGSDGALWYVSPGGARLHAAAFTE